MIGAFSLFQIPLLLVKLVLLVPDNACAHLLVVFLILINDLNDFVLSGKR
jgi:hypothetical protein